MRDYIRSFFTEDIKVKEKSKDVLPDDVMKLKTLFEETFVSGKVIVFGNGGCAGIAQQMAASFIGRFSSDKKAKPVICLASEAAMITTMVNDFGYEKIYVKQLEGLMSRGDLVIGISTSGNSINVVRGIEYAKQNGGKTVGFTGENGGQLADIAGFVIKAPSSNPSHIESIFSAVNSILCKVLD